MSALPAPSYGLACRMSGHFTRVTHVFPRFWIAKQLALPAREAETSVNQRWAEEPLRYEDPICRYKGVARYTLESARGERGVQWCAKGRVREEEDCESECGPEPSDFDEVDVENVFLLGEVGGSYFGGVRLGEVAVRCVACCVAQEGEETAEEESEWVQTEQERFQSRW